MHRLLFATIALMLCPAAAAAEQWPPLDDIPQVIASGANDVAVIVAVQDYLLLPDIPGAVDNANEWEVFLRSGLKVPQVHVLANQDATREAMLKFAQTAAADVGEGGTIWWIFIGHGAPAVDGKDGLLVGMDAQQSVESLTARGLPQQELLAALDQGRGRTVMIVDACFSGRSSSGEALAAGVQPVVAVDPTAGLRSNSVVLSAAKSTEVAGQLDGAARPAFSYLLLGALRGWADDGDGAVSAGEALYYTQRKLRGVKGRQQTPQGAGDLQLVMVRGVQEQAPRVVAEGIAGEQKSDLEPSKAAPAGDNTAALTLEYLQRRLVFEGRTVRQAGRILNGPAFYHAIDRPDLAAKWKSHNPYMWLPGIAATAGGLALFVYGVGGALGDGGFQTGRIIGGVMGGFFTMAGGISLLTFGFIADYNPMSFSERKSAAESLNGKLREERGLGPEVDWQNQPATGRRGLFGSGPSRRSPLVGFTLQF